MVSELTREIPEETARELDRIIAELYEVAARTRVGGQLMHIRELTTKLRRIWKR